MRSASSARNYAELRQACRSSSMLAPFKQGDCFTFTTAAGNLDCLGTPSGTRGYSDLLQNATEEDLEIERA